MNFRTLMSPFAKSFGYVIGSNSFMLDLFRKLEFKGKQYLAGYLKLKTPNGIYKANGMLWDLNFDDAIQREIYLGIFERRELKYLRDFIRPGWICLDIGANVGFYTLNLAKLVGEHGAVYSIEASPENYKTLVRNLELNHLPVSQASQLAISSKDGELQFIASTGGNSGWGRVSQDPDHCGAYTVVARTLDTYLTENKIEKIDFLKIDIEGHEMEFLKGGSRSFTDGRIKYLMVEYCGQVLSPMGISPKDYVTAIQHYGFRPVHLNLDSPTEPVDATLRRSGAVINMLFESKSH